SLAAAKDAVAGLLKVMGLEKEVSSHGSVEKAIEHFKDHLEEQIGKKGGSLVPSKPVLTGEMAAARPEGRLAVEESGEELLFYPPGKRPPKKDMAGDTVVLT